MDTTSSWTSPSASRSTQTTDRQLRIPYNHQHLLATLQTLDDDTDHQHRYKISSPRTIVVDISDHLDMTAQQLPQIQNGGILSSRDETFYSAAAILTIAGIFVALTLTATLALFVFWRKTNTVFVLQKCEQEDYATEDNNSTEENEEDDNNMNEEVRTESDSDGAVRQVIVKKKSSARRPPTSKTRKRWLPVELEDVDAILQNDAMTSDTAAPHSCQNSSPTKRKYSGSDNQILTSVISNDEMTLETLLEASTNNCVVHLETNCNSLETMT